MSDDELNSSRSGYDADKKKLGIDDATQRKWQDFTNQLDRAGESIKKIFVTGLDPLLPSLSKLSASFGEAVASFLSTPKLKIWIEDLGVEIKKFSEYLGSEQFASDSKQFIESVGSLAKAIVSALEWLGIIPRHAAPTDPAPKLGATAGDAKGVSSFWSLFGKVRFGKEADMQSAIDKGQIPESINQKKGDARFQDPNAENQKYLSGLEDKYKLPSGMLDKIWATESSRGRNLTGPLLANGDRALGPFQFVKGTREQYGLKNPMDFAQSADAAGRKMRDLLKEYHGDTEKATAAYNWGDGNLNKDIRKNGADWKNHLPAQTADYIRRTAVGVKIDINNNTGGSVNITAKQVAQ